jgi:DNA-binding response OmpR family regulator
VTGARPGVILLVEDDPTLAGLLEHHLSAHGYEVRTVPSAEEVASSLEAGPRPSLVLLDINLPGDTGWSLLRSGPLAGPDHPQVVVMTSLTVSPRRLEEFDVAGYLPKPFPMETLLTTVERLSAGRSLEGGSVIDG